MYQPSDLISEFPVAMKTILDLCKPWFKLSQSNRLRLFSASSILLILISGCDSQTSKSKFKSNTQPNDLEAVNSPVPLKSTSTKLKLTLDSPESLTVKQGDLIVKGQVLVDRSAARQKITARKLKLEQEAALLSVTADIPTTSTTDVAATAADEVKLARERVRSAESTIQDYLAKSPYTDAARRTLPLPEEEKQLAQLQANKAQAQAQLDQAINRLNSAQSAQQSRQQIQTDSSSRKQQLSNELKTIEAQLKALQDILSPHDAIVQGIEWQEKGKNGTTVELALAVHSPSELAPPLSSTSNDPLLSIPNDTPALPTGSQPFPSPANPANSPGPSPSSLAPQTTTPIQVPTTSSN